MDNKYNDSTQDAFDFARQVGEVKKVIVKERETADKMDHKAQEFGRIKDKPDIPQAPTQEAEVSVDYADLYHKGDAISGLTKHGMPDNAKVKADIKRMEADNKQKLAEEREIAEAEREAKKQRTRDILNAVGDGVSAISNLVTTGLGAPNMIGGETLSAKSKSRYDKLLADKQAQASARNKANMEILLKQMDLANAREIAQGNRDAKNEQWKEELAEEIRHNQAMEEIGATNAGANKTRADKNQGGRSGGGRSGGGRKGKEWNLMTADGEVGFDTKSEYHAKAYEEAMELGIPVIVKQGTKRFKKNGDQVAAEVNRHYGGTMVDRVGKMANKASNNGKTKINIL